MRGGRRDCGCLYTIVSVVLWCAVQATDGSGPAPRGSWTSCLALPAKFPSVRHPASISHSPLDIPFTLSLLPRASIQRIRGCMRNHHVYELFIAKEGGKMQRCESSKPSAVGPLRRALDCTDRCRTTHSIVPNSMSFYMLCRICVRGINATQC
jgi:hypothetical protein